MWMIVNGDRNEENRYYDENIGRELEKEGERKSY